MNPATVSLTTTLLLALGCNATASAADTVGDCRIGSYRLSDSSDVDIGPADNQRLRWRRKDGTSGALSQNADGSWTSTLGWTERPDGKRVTFSDCGSGELRFDGLDGKRIDLNITDTRFQAGDVSLAGRLVMPKERGTVPVVVLVHGSERSSARDFYALQRLFPSAGIGVFVYDKRGTGASGGEYSQDYNLLAKDAVAALREAQRMAGSRVSRIGYQGTSQGGWVAPLAATLAPVDFIVVGYGLAVSPIDEDRAALELDMTRHGYGADAVAKALEIGAATEAILVSNFTAGFDRLAAVVSRYGKEPWFKHVHGNFTFLALQMSEAELREQGPKFAPGIAPHYDPMPVLRSLNTPQLWILGAEDLDAPSAETIRRLHALADAGKPIVTAVFPHAEHGIFEFETATDRTRLSTRNADGYFSMMRDYIVDGRLREGYGSSSVRAAAMD